MSDDAELNAYLLKEKIESLAITRGAARQYDEIKYRNYSNFWKEVNEIRELFKELTPLAHKDREILWNKYSELCQEVKKEQKENYEYRLGLSNKYYYQIKELINYAVVSDDAFNVPTIDELKHGAELLKRAGVILHDYKNSMLSEHKNECFDNIQRVREAHDKIWAKIKHEKDRRHEEFEARVKANLAKNYERYNSLTSALERVQSNADKLRGNIDDAWSEDYVARASRWLSESEDQIRDIEKNIGEVEEWIHEDEHRLHS